MMRPSIVVPIVALMLGCMLCPVVNATDAAAGGDPVFVPGQEAPPEGLQPLAACDTCEVGPWFAGAEYRYMRAHFSEAVAFVQVQDNFTNPAFQLERQVVAEELSFDYESSMRLFFGSHIGDNQDLRFAYWYFDTSVDVDRTVGNVSIPGTLVTLVDPFGNIVPAGSSINTQASVNMNVFDLEYLQTMNYPRQDVDFVYSAGLRFADINQDYDSVVRNPAGVTTASGVFSADYSGIGPYLTLQGNTSHWNRQFSLVAKGGAALLIGHYDVASQVTIPGFASGGQTAGRTRAVPILEGELGGAWRPTDRLTISAGWLFYAWFNVGTSGGGFDGEGLPAAPIDTTFGQTDDADIMSFDGLFVRAEVWF